MALEKFPFLERLTLRLAARTCAVGRNADWQDWDLQVRRGALGEARLRMAVEHHGGPTRVAKLSAVIGQSKTFYWVQGTLAASALTMGALGLHLPFVVLASLLALSLLAPTVEASRLETAIRSAAHEVAAELVTAETRPP